MAIEKKTETISREKWSIDSAHSEISFKVKHLLITNLKGIFREFRATIYSKNEEQMTSEIFLWINTASIHTNNDMRDQQLKGANLFDTGNYKQITFIGSHYEKTDKEGSYILHGELTIKNITRMIALEVEYGGEIKDSWRNNKVCYTINGKINRKEWDLNWTPVMRVGDVIVGDEVKINCEFQFAKQS
jgi:polyisoprenoid-binding protein YceI